MVKNGRVKRNICLPFLRCFGAKISHLTVSKFNDEQLDVVQQYINQYCANSLTCIAFYGAWAFSVEIFKNPFKNVGEVFIWHNDLKDQLPNFVKWFPGMRYLDMNAVTIDANAIEIFFPHLEHLTISIDDDSHGLALENATKLLHANKHLESLNIESCLGIMFDNLLCMLNGNSSISKLSVYLNWNSFVEVTTTEMMRFAIEHPLMAELDLLRYRSSFGDIVATISRLKSLKKFICHVKDHSGYDIFRNQIGNEWQSNISINPDACFIFLER